MWRKHCSHNTPKDIGRYKILRYVLSILKKRVNKRKETIKANVLLFALQKRNGKQQRKQSIFPMLTLSVFFFFFNEGHFIFVRFQEDFMKYCWVYFRHNFCINQHTDSSHAHNKNTQQKPLPLGQLSSVYLIVPLASKCLSSHS